MLVQPRAINYSFGPIRMFSRQDLKHVAWTFRFARVNGTVLTAERRNRRFHPSDHL
jgi:hypothetical protein